MIDRSWLELFEQDDTSFFLHDPDFIHIINKVYGCIPFHRVIESKEGLTGVPAYLVKRSLFGKKITSQPFNFYSKLLGICDEEGALRHLVKQARELGPIWYVEFKTFAELPVGRVEEIGEVRRVSPLVNSHLELENDYDLQNKKYRKSLRQNLRTTFRRAEEQSISLMRTTRREDVQRFYNVLCRLNRDKHRMISHPISLYMLFFDELVKKEKGDFFLAKRNGEILAGIVVLKSTGHWEYAWGASKQEFGQLGLNSLLVDFMVQNAIAKGVKTVGFGTSSPNDLALLYFKERWGCMHRPVHFYYWNKIPRVIDLETSGRKLRRLLHFVPISVIRLTSPWIVPWLA